MKSRVYFTATNSLDKKEDIQQKFQDLLEKSNLLDFICLDDKVAIKMHFGEEANTGFVKPEYVRLLCAAIAVKKSRPFLIDTNTLYRGKRANSKEHRQLAYAHGFKPQILGAEVLIPEDTQENTASIRINQRFIKIAKINQVFLDADAIIGVAHFKGHMMTGFGGALKNLGMGCASREGKLAQHSDVSPLVKRSKCVGCGACEQVCPVKAITIKNKKSFIFGSLCMGCASCIAVCPNVAIDVDWESGEGNIQEKMVEYVKAVLDRKKEKKAFINFAIKITQECDCIAKDDPSIVSDIGILASFDPVSLDKASLDLVNKVSGKDIFKEMHPQRDGLKQLRYASELGLGNLEYELISI